MAHTLIDFSAILQDLIPSIEDGIRRFAWPEASRNHKITQAMDYSLLAGGKRLRPALTLLACESCGGDVDAAMPVAVAIEILHTYSLIHDDLPAMDNDSLRRGRPTNHKVFGEATAILAGDAMLTYALQLVAKYAPDAERAQRLIVTLTQAAGVGGMVGGQQDDLDAENAPDLKVEDLIAIHERKTGRLIAASLVCGAIVARADDQIFRALDAFGMKLGLAFQVVDDLLDVTSSREELGKSIGKDDAQNKLTYPRLLGIEGSRAEATRLVEEALEIAEAIPNNTKLCAAANYIVNRSK